MTTIRQATPVQTLAGQPAVRSGALLLALALLGYALYELLLLPRAGLPTDDMAVILAGADTLRVGHWLKFGYAGGLALLTVGLFAQRQRTWPLTASLMALSGAGAAILFVASGTVGLRILDMAEFFSATNPVDARTTILIRIVTQSLQLAALFLAGWLPLLSSLIGLAERNQPRGLAWLGVLIGIALITIYALPRPIDEGGPLLAIFWSLWLAWPMSISPKAAMAGNNSTMEKA